MIRTKEITKETYFCDEDVGKIGEVEIDFLKAKVPHNPRARARMCFHKDTNAALQEMFVVYVPETYNRPNKHQVESLHILEGAADFVFFDENGKVTQVLPLGDRASGKQSYCRMPEQVYHTLFIRTPEIVIHEARLGPFQKADTIFAPWSPEEGTPQVEPWLKDLEKILATKFSVDLKASKRPLIRLNSSSKEVHTANELVVNIGPAEVDFLKLNVSLTARKRIRICAHEGPEAKLHEMFMIFPQRAYMRPSRHPIDESLHLIEGSATYVFFNNDGKIMEVVRLGGDRPDRNLYCRVPTGYYHTLIIHSEQLVFRQTTTGPFNKADTSYAPWAPAEDDPKVGDEWLRQLEAKIGNM